MARPKKKNADYFSHDSDMRNDPKIRALRRKYGIIGYAVWSMILEILTDADYFEYEWSDLNIELLAGDFDIEPDNLREIVDYCITLKLIIKEDNKIFSEKMKERFESLLIKRNRDRESSKKEKTPTEKPKEEVSADENPQSKGEESKVDQNKKLDKRLLSEIDISEVPSELQEYYKIAIHFQKLFIKNLKERNSPTKNQEKAKFKNYVTPIRLMIENDGTSREQIREASDFLKSKDGEFWKANILSTSKLREKIDQLIAQKNSPKTQQNGNSNSKSEPTVNRQSAEVIYSNSQGW